MGFHLFHAGLELPVLFRVILNFYPSASTSNAEITCLHSVSGLCVAKDSTQGFICAK